MYCGENTGLSAAACRPPGHPGKAQPRLPCAVPGSRKVAAGDSAAAYELHRVPVPRSAERRLCLFNVK